MALGDRKKNCRLNNGQINHSEGMANLSEGILPSFWNYTNDGGKLYFQTCKGFVNVPLQ